MAAYDLFYLSGTKQKRLPSASSTVDFLSIKIGASGLEILENSGHFDFSAKRLTNLAAPSTGSDAATKSYVDTAVAASAGGFDTKDACQLATTATLAADYDNGTAGVGATLTGQSNGALSMDGVTVEAGWRLLVKNQTDATENGLYDVTTVGDGSNPFVITRTMDFNGTPVGEVTGGAKTHVIDGTTYTGWDFFVTGDGQANRTIGTDDIDWGVLDSTPTGTAASGGGVKGKLSADSDLGLGVTAGVLRAKVSGQGVDFSGTNIALKLDGGTLSQSGSGAKVADAGITGTQLAGSVAGAGLAGGAGSALSVNVDGSTIEIATDTLQVKDLGISTAKIADAAVTAAKLAAAVAGAGLTGGAGSALAVGAGDGIAVSADAVAVDYTAALVNDNAGTITVRQVVYVKSNGHVDKALASTAAVVPGVKIGLVADATILTTATGAVYVRHGAKVGGFTSLTVGAPIYLSRSTAGSYQQDLSGFVAGEAVVELGEVISATEIIYKPEYKFEY